jgi:hypothetical protein
MCASQLNALFCGHSSGQAQQEQTKKVEIRMIPDRQEQDADPNRPDSKWRRLYRYGGICSLIMVAIVPIQIVVFVVSPPPQTVEGWFKLFQESALLGLLSFELLFLLYGILSVPLSLSLYFALRRTNPPIAILYIALSMLSVVAVFTARPAFEMLHLSGQYAAATTEAQRAVCLAAGQSMLAIWHGTAFTVCYVLGSVTGLIVSLLMLQGKIFAKGIAYIRILSSVLDFTLFIPVIGLFLSIGSAVLLMIWNVLVGRRLLQMAREGPMLATGSTR